MTDSNSFLAPLEKRVEALEKAAAKLVDQHEPLRCHLATPEWVAKLKVQAGSGSAVADARTANALQPGTGLPEPSLITFVIQLRNGGSIISSSACDETEIAVARACGRMYVDGEGFGYVYRPRPEPPVDSEGETGFKPLPLFGIDDADVYHPPTKEAWMAQLAHRAYAEDQAERRKQIVNDLRAKLEAAEREADTWQETAANREIDLIQLRSKLDRARAVVEAARRALPKFGYDDYVFERDMLASAIRAFDAKG